MIITIPDHRLAFQSPVFALSSALLATSPMIVSTTPYRPISPAITVRTS
jgi:hypothetical protein